MQRDDFAQLNIGNVVHADSEFAKLPATVAVLENGGEFSEAFKQYFIAGAEAA